MSAPAAAAAPAPPRLQPVPASPYPPLPRSSAASASSSSAARTVRRPLFGGALFLSLPSHWRDVSQVREVPDHQEVWQDYSGSGPGPGPGSGACLIVEILDLQDDVSDSEAGRYFFDDLADANGAPPESKGGRRVDASGVERVGAREAADDSDEEGDEDEGNDEEHDNGEDVDGEDDGRGGGDGDGGGEGGTTPADGGPPRTPANNLLPNLRTRAAAALCLGAQRIARGRGLALSDRSRSDGQEEAEWVRIELCAIRLRRVRTDLLVTLSVPLGDAENGTAEAAGGAPSERTTEVEDGKGNRGGGLGLSETFRRVLQSLRVDDWALFA